MKYLLLIIFAFGICMEAEAFSHIALQAILIITPISILLWKQNQIIKN